MLFLRSHHHQPFQYQTHTAEQHQQPQEPRQKKKKREEAGEGEEKMKVEEDQAKWFSHWEEQLPSPEELTPVTQTLITPDLALAFDIIPNRSPPPPSSNSPAPPPPPPPHLNSSEFVDSADLGSGAGVDEPARTLKRPRLVWTPQLHKRFVDAVAHLGIKNAVPKTIMQLMSVDGLTRENVASHLQKYRLYLKRMQGLSGGGAATGGGISAADAAADHLFASAPVPHHFLHRGGGGPPPPPSGAVGSEHYLPFVPVAALQHHHHQMSGAAVAAAQQQQFQRQLGHFGSPPGGQFEHGFLARQQSAMHRMVGTAVSVPAPAGPAYIEDLDSSVGGGGRKVLTLFPTGDD